MKGRPAGGGLTEWIRRAFTDNLGLKLLSIVAAIVLFSLVRGAEDAQRSVFVDIVAILPSSDSNKILISELPDQVRVTLQGSRSILNTVRREEIEPIQVDLSDPELRYYYFEPTGFEIPAGVTIVQLAPASIPLTWADRVERTLPLSAELVGEPGPGLSVQDINIEPEEVTIRGAQNEIDPLGSVSTEPIDVTGLAPGRHERRVRLERAPAHSTYDGSGTVRVLLEVIPEIDTRTIEGVSIEIVGPPGRTRPSSADVTLRGSPERMNQLDRSRVVPYVDAQDPSLVGTTLLPIQVRGIPSEIEVVGVEPAETLVTVTRRPQPTQ